MTVFLPHAKRQPGRKVVIGDSLSSHFTSEVVQACEENNIAFLCLVPNSTHLLQPLDVGFFRPFKIAWRKIIADYKQKNPRTKGIPKSVFPELLKNSLSAMDTIPCNVLLPIARQRMLKRFLQPECDEQQFTLAENSLIKFVEDVEKLYGSSYYKFNTRVLLHIPDCVKNFGMLWANSTFSFENANGTLVNMLHNSQAICISVHKLLVENVT